jgi:hypothetical protein
MQTDQLSYERPDQAQLIALSQRQLTVAKEITIDSAPMYEAAADELKAIKKAAKELEDKRVGITKPIDEAKKAVMDLFRRPLEILGEAETVLKRAMITYADEQEKIRREEQAKLDAIAKAERERLAAEAKAKQEEAERLAQAAQDSGDEQAFAQAAQAAAEAQVMESTVAVMTAPTATTAAAKVSGISARGVWKAECTDKIALIKFIAQNDAFINLLDVNQSALNQLAKAMKQTLNLPGVRAYEERSLAATKG